MVDGVLILGDGTNGGVDNTDADANANDKLLLLEWEYRVLTWVRYMYYHNTVDTEFPASALVGLF